MSVSLTNLVYTRISHDLSNAAGAVYNGTELLAEDPVGVQETAVLLQNSARVLMARLKFFRQAFGLPNIEADDATPDYLETLSTPVKLIGFCVDPLCKVCVMVLADCLISGGTVQIEDDKITATGPAIKVAPELRHVLEDGQSVTNPALAPALYAFRLAQKQHIRFLFQADEEKQVISLKKVVNS